MSATSASTCPFCGKGKNPSERFCVHCTSWIPWHLKRELAHGKDQAKAMQEAMDFLQEHSPVPRFDPEIAKLCMRTVPSLGTCRKLRNHREPHVFEQSVL